MALFPIFIFLFRLFKQMLFESPSLPIVPFKMKTVNREDKVVPFEYIR